MYSFEPCQGQDTDTIEVGGDCEIYPHLQNHEINDTHIYEV